MHATGLDFETYGEESIWDVGLENYVTQPSFQVLTATLAEVVDGVPVNHRFFDFVTGGDTALDAFKRAMRTLDTVCAHNAAFEQRVLEFLGAWIPVSVLWDTSVMSRQEGGSSSLAQAAAQLLPPGVGKLDEGTRLIRKFSMGPTPPTAESVKNDPDWQTFAEYNIRDAQISAMIATGHWYQCAPRKDIDYPSTYRMNREGWFVDIPLVKEISKRYEQNKKDLLDEFHANFTKPWEEPLNFRSHKQKKTFCQDRGVKAVSFDEMHVEQYLAALDKKMQDPKLEPGKATQYAEVYQMLKVHQQLGAAVEQASIHTGSGRGGQHGTDTGSDQIKLGNHHVPVVQNPGNRLIDNAQIQRTRLGAEDHRRQTFNEESQTDGRHEQGNRRLIDQFSQHELFGRDTECGHDGEGQNHRQPQGLPGRAGGQEPHHH